MNPPRRSADPGERALRSRLRATFRQARQSLNATERARYCAEALARFSNSTLTEALTRVGLFVSTPEEMPTAPFIDWCLQNNIVVALPAITDRATGAMELRAHTNAQPLVPGSLGIPEPPSSAAVIPATRLDLLFLPLVAFDTSGARLGMGGGYYDRLLGAIAAEARPLLVGLAFDNQCCDRALPTASWDIGLDLVLTERALLGCSERGRARLQAEPT